MEAGKFTYLSYRWHSVCNPFGFDLLERTLQFAELSPGERAFDLGAGNARVAAWIAARFGLEMTAVERFAPVAALAEATADAFEGPGSLTVARAAARPFLAEAGKAKLISVIGAVNLLGETKEPAEAFRALKAYLEPGGYLLWGDPFWKRDPSPGLAAIFRNERYQSHAGYVAAGEAAGLTPIYAGVSSDQDWDDYSWRMNASVEAWLAENPDDPDAPAIRAQIGMMRRLYVEEAREAMGFGLYLFRA